MIELMPIRENPKDFEDIEQAIIALLKKEIYLPLILSLGFKSKILKNSIDALIDAIHSGLITYSNGRFSGRFNSTLSRELRGLGARWDRKQGTWNIPPSKLSIDIRNTISLAENKYQEKLISLTSKIDKIDAAKLAEKLDVKKMFDAVLSKIEKNFIKSIDGLGVAPTTDPARIKRMSDEYTQNLQKYVKDFAEKEIKTLRKDIESNVLTGNRYEGLIGNIQKSYGVSYNKAKFLARQETKLATVKYKQIRCEDAGIEYYKWRCVAGSSAHPVRPMHLALNGTIQRWDQPPITDEKGNRNNAGEDYNCRCVAIPIVKF